MSLLRTISIFLFVALLTLGFVPFGTFAASTSTVIISVQDQSNLALSGNWYLHQGTTLNGALIRNGSSGEIFEVDSGSYFLEVRNLLGSYPYYLLHSDNPLFVDEDATITFNVQYFETEEQMLIASGNPPEPTSEPEDEGLVGYDVYDAHGCNSTQGFVWCASSEACVKFWSPACRVDEDEEEEEEVADTTSESTPPTILATSPAVHVPTFETPPMAVVPTFETPPYAFAPEVSDAGDFDIEVAAAGGMQLAQTGSSVALLLIPSMLLGLATFRRKD